MAENDEFPSAPSPAMQDEGRTVIQLYGSDKRVAQLLQGVWQLTFSDDYVAKACQRLRKLKDDPETNIGLDDLLGRVTGLEQSRNIAYQEALVFNRMAAEAGVGRALCQSEIEERTTKYMRGAVEIAKQTLEQYL